MSTPVASPAADSVQRFKSLRANTDVGNAGQKPLRLVDLYKSYFDIEPAETAEQLKTAFQLRYQVYCVENSFEDPEANPHGLEIDEYDSRSLHSLLVHRATTDVVGTVRLILPGSDNESIGLPIGDVCTHEFIHRDDPGMPWATTAEISRFGISKTLRRRDGDLNVAGSTCPPEYDPRRRIPDTSLGLMQAVIAMAAKAGVDASLRGHGSDVAAYAEAPRNGDPVAW